MSTKNERDLKELRSLLLSVDSNFRKDSDPNYPNLSSSSNGISEEQEESVYDPTKKIKIPLRETKTMECWRCHQKVSS